MYNIVITPCKELRMKALESLKGKWKIAVLSTLVFMLFSGGFSLFSYFFENTRYEGLMGIVIFVISGPLMLGYYGFCIKLRRGEEVEVSDVFEGFKNFGSAFLLQLLMSIFVLLWTLLLIIPGIIAGIRYSQAFLILYDNPGISPIDALRESKKMMKGNKWKFFILSLSFIGWAILCAFTFGIGSLWLSPYIYVTMVVFYETILTKDDTDGFYRQQPQNIINEETNNSKELKHGFYE